MQFYWNKENNNFLHLGTPGREANFEDKARNFQAHAARLADTANSVATAGGCPNKQTVEAIFKNSAQARFVY